MAIDVQDVKKLRDMTGAGMMTAKKALEETNGDIEAAVIALRKAGVAKAAKRAEREAGAGTIVSYVHSGRIGVLVEINCETDFVARTEDFTQFGQDIAMHVAAANPEYLTPEDVPADVIARENEVFAAEVEGKPEEVKAKILEGKLNKYFEGVCLTKQGFIKDPDKTVEQLTAEVIAKTGENVVIRRFARFELGGAV